MHDYSNPHTQLKFSVASSWNTNTFWNTRSVVVSKSLVLCSVPSFACFAVASPRHRVICLVRSHFDWARRKARVERIPRLSCFCAHVRRALEAQLNSGACWFGQASVSSDRPSTEREMMLAEPLRSAMTIGRVEDTSLALPSDARLHTGAHRVLDQVQTIKRSKSKHGKNGTPTSMEQLCY